MRPHDPRGLCRAILRPDEDVTPAAAAYCPERADFVRVWRGMGRDYQVGRDLGAVLARCPGDMEPETYCLCLMVFQEAGLLSDGPDGIFSARPVQIEGKADLESTPLIRELRRRRAEQSE